MADHLDPMDRLIDTNEQQAKNDSPDAEAPKQNRDVVDDFTAGLRDSTNDGEATPASKQIEAFAARQFPESYSVYEGAQDIKSDLETIRDDTMKTVAPALQTFKRTGRLLLPRVKAYLPDETYKKLEKQLATKEELEDQRVLDVEESKKKFRNAFVDSKIEALFKQQVVQNENARLEGKTDKMIDRVVDNQRHRESITGLAQIATPLQDISTFIQNPYTAYLKKSIALKYKHIFITQDIYANLDEMSTNISTQLANITKNTSLPDIQKKRMLEGFKEKTLETVSGKATETIDEWRRNFLPNAMENIKERFLDPFVEGVQGINDAAELYNSTAGSMDDMMADMGDFLDEDELAEMSQQNPFVYALGQSFRQFLINKGKGKLLDTVAGLSGQYRDDIEGRAALFMKTIPHRISDMLSGSSNEFVQMFAEIFNNLPKERGMVSNTIFDNPTAQVDFDVMTRKSIIEIIPGYLSKILKEVSELNIGMPQEELVYDPKTERFTKESKFKETTNDYLFGFQEDRQAALGNTLSRIGGGYALNGGDIEEFNAILPDIVKFINNSAKHAAPFNPEAIEDISKDKYNTTANRYLDRAFTDIDNPQLVAQVLYRALHDDENRRNVTLETTLGEDIFGRMSTEDNYINRLSTLSNAMGYKHRMADVIGLDGTLEHDNIRNLRNTDLDYEELREEVRERAPWAVDDYKFAEGERGIASRQSTQYLRSFLNDGFVGKAADKTISAFDSFDNFIRYLRRTDIDDIIADSKEAMSEENIRAKMEEIRNGDYSFKAEDFKKTIHEIFDVKEIQNQMNGYEEKIASLQDQLNQVIDENTPVDVGAVKEELAEYKGRIKEFKTTLIENATKHGVSPDFYNSLPQKTKEKLLNSDLNYQSKIINLLEEKSSDLPLAISDENENDSDSTIVTVNGKKIKITKSGADELPTADLSSALNSTKPEALTPEYLARNSKAANWLKSQQPELENLLSNIPNMFEKSTREMTKFWKESVHKIPEILSSPEGGFSSSILLDEKSAEPLITPVNEIKDLLTNVYSTIQEGREQSEKWYQRKSAMDEQILTVLLESTGVGGYSDGDSDEEDGLFLTGRARKKVKGLQGFIRKTIGNTLGAGKKLFIDTPAFMYKNIATLGVSAINRLMGTNNPYVDVYRKDEVDPENPLLTRKQLLDGVFDSTGKKVKSVWNLTDVVLDREGNILISKEDLIHGLVDVNNKPLLESKASALKLLGRAGSWAGGVVDTLAGGYAGWMKGVGSFIGKAGKFLFESEADPFCDVYRKGEVDPGNPLVKAKLFREGRVVFADGSGVLNVKDIDRPVIDVRTKETLISRADIEHGLVDIEGNPISKRKGTSSLFGKLLGAGFKGVGKLGSFALDAGKAILKPITSFYGDLLGLIPDGLHGIGRQLGKIFDWGVAYSIKRDDIQELITSRLDNIYVLLQDRLGGKVMSPFDQDGDGDRDGSYADLMEQRRAKREEREVKRRARKEARDRRRLGLLPGGAATSKSDKDDDDSGLWDMATAGLGGLGLQKGWSWLKGKFGKQVAEEGVEQGMKKGAAKGAEKAASSATKTAGKGATKVGSQGASLFGKLGKYGEKALGMLPGSDFVSKHASKLAKYIPGQTLGKAAAEIGGKAIGKVAAKKIPVIGALAGAAFAWDRLKKGDFIGASGEVLSGLASVIPLVGTAVSIGIDSALIGWDMWNMDSDNPRWNSLKARMKLYGFEKPTDTDIKNIAELEQLTDRILNEDADKLGEDGVREWTARFGLNSDEERAPKYWYTWYTRRFTSIFLIYRNILEANDHDYDDIDDISTEDHAKMDAELENAGRRYATRYAKALPTLAGYTAMVKALDDNDPTKKKLDKVDIGDKNQQNAAKDGTEKKDKKKKPFVKEKTWESATMEEKIRMAKAEVARRKRDTTTSLLGDNGMPNVDAKLGSLSAQYESSKKGSMAIGYDRTGGTSYGKYQIASNTGTFDKFVQWLTYSSDDPNAKEVAQRLSNAGDANTGSSTGSVPNEWRNLVKMGLMGNLEHDFIKATHYDVALGMLEDDVRRKVETTKALQQVLWSTAVQHGARGGARIFNRAARDENSTTAIIRKIYEDRSTKFRSSTSRVRESVRNRFYGEQRQALAMLTAEDDRRYKSSKLVSDVGKSGKGNQNKKLLDEIRAVPKPTRSSTNAKRNETAEQPNVTVNVPEDKKQHKLTEQTVSELQSVSSSIQELSKTMKSALTDKNSPMNKIAANTEQALKKKDDTNIYVNNQRLDGVQRTRMPKTISVKKTGGQLGDHDYTTS